MGNSQATRIAALLMPFITASILNSLNLNTAFASQSCIALFNNNASTDSSEITQSPPQKLIEIAKESFAYRGLTPHGIRFIKQTRDILRRRTELFASQLKNLTTVHHAMLVARLFGRKGRPANMLLYGPPGGAKSATTDHFISGEAKPAFNLMLNESMTERVIVGGEDFNAAKRGEYVINTKTSMLDSEVANFDEIDKANPLALTPLLSIMHKGEALLGKRTVVAATEIILASSNSNLPEILQKFIENGHGPTGPALLNTDFYRS